MSTHIFDIDGTLVEWHTNKWLPGAFKMLQKLSNKGDDIILMTMRGPQDAGEVWSESNTRDTILQDLDNAGIRYRILFDVQPYRTIYDDTAPRAIHRVQNQWW